MSLSECVMSLKTAFAAVLKAMRGARGLSQKNLAEVSSRTYVSKLERAQSSPTLEMMHTLSPPLNLSPLTLVAITIATDTGESIRSLINRIEDETSELARVGVLKQLHIPESETTRNNRPTALSRERQPVKVSQQTEFSFAD